MDPASGSSTSTLLTTRFEFSPSSLYKQDEAELLSGFTVAISITNENSGNLEGVVTAPIDHCEADLEVTVDMSE